MKFYPFCLNTRLLKTSKARGRRCTTVLAKQAPAPTDYNPEQPKPNGAGAVHRALGSSRARTQQRDSSLAHPRAPDTPHVQGKDLHAPSPNIRLIQAEKLQITRFCDNCDKAPLSKVTNNWKVLAPCLPGQAPKTVLPLINQEIS